MKYLKRNITFLLKENKLSSSDFAAKMEWTLGRFSSYSTGRIVPKLDDVIQMANFFNLSLDEFVHKDLEKDGVDTSYQPLDDSVLLRALRDRIIRLEDVIMNSDHNKEALDRAIAELEELKKKGK